MERKQYFIAPFGKLMLLEKNGAIAALQTASHEEPSVPEEETPLLLEAKKQLEEYFQRQRKAFDLPLSPEGTAFQRRVWDALLTIPYGVTWSYLQLARAVGNPKACRAVGGANGKNPIMIIIPCHRVIAADGGLGGYSGGLHIKTALLELEQSSPK